MNFISCLFCNRKYSNILRIFCISLMLKFWSIHVIRTVWFLLCFHWIFEQFLNRFYTKCRFLSGLFKRHSTWPVYKRGGLSKRDQHFGIGSENNSSLAWLIVTFVSSASHQSVSIIENSVRDQCCICVCFVKKVPMHTQPYKENYFPKFDQIQEFGIGYLFG